MSLDDFARDMATKIEKFIFKEGVWGLYMEEGMKVLGIKAPLVEFGIGIEKGYTTEQVCRFINEFHLNPKNAIDFYNKYKDTFIVNKIDSIE